MKLLLVLLLCAFTRAEGDDRWLRDAFPEGRPRFVRRPPAPIPSAREPEHSEDLEGPSVEGRMVCTMNMHYTEYSRGFLIFNDVSITGSALMICGETQIPLRVTGGGAYIGARIPDNWDGSQRRRLAVSNIEVSLPLGTDPRLVTGTYDKALIDVLGVGVGLSPFLNTNRSLGITLQFPRSFRLNAGFDFTSLHFYAAAD